MRSVLKGITSLSLLIFLLLCTTNTAQAQISVVDTLTVEELVNDYLLGAGVDATNITFNGMPGDQVYLKVGLVIAEDSEFPFDTSIAITTGPISSVIDGDGFGDGDQTDDPDLVAIAGFNINNQGIIEFDFEVVGDSVNFNYIFASAEYPGFTCSSFNDAFGFFLSGPNINGPFTNEAVNIALIPGTDIPVAINTVNSGVASSGDGSECEEANPNWEEDSQYFIDNDPQLENSIGFAGHTVSLPAKYGVECGETYHIKMAIGNASDQSLQSAVFLQANSFTVIGNIYVNANPTINGATVSEPGYEGVLVEGCSVALIDLIRPANYDGVVDTVYFSGTAEPGVDYTVPSTTQWTFPEGIDTLTFSISVIPDEFENEDEYLTVNVVSTNFCTGQTDTSSVSIPIVDPYGISATGGTFTAICPADSIIVSAEGGDGISPYHYSLVTPFDSLPFITTNDFFAPVPEVGQADYTVWVTDACGFDTIPATITVVNGIPDFLSVLIAEPAPAYCPNDPLTVVATGQDGNPFTTGQPFDYLYEWSNGMVGSSITVNLDTTTTIELTLTDSCGTQITDSVTFTYPNYEPLEVSFEPFEVLCPGDPVPLTATVTGGEGTVHNFIWREGNSVVGTEPTTVVNPDNILTNTTYSVEVTDLCNFADTFNYVYFLDYFPLNGGVISSKANCMGDELVLQIDSVEGGREPYFYLWDGPGDLVSLDSATGTAVIQFPDTSSYVVTVNDVCNYYPLTVGHRPEIVVMAEAPNVITPNGDKRNDEFIIKGLNPVDFPDSKLQIYNRWGRIVFETSTYENNWGGEDLLDGTYYYVLTIDGGECVHNGTIEVLGSTAGAN